MRHLTATALLAVWRRSYHGAFRIGFWYLLGAVALTVFWVAALGLAPDTGLTRSYWYPVDAATEPIIDERIAAIDLAFIDERNRPTRNYRVRWEGVWFSPRAERVDFHAGADDGVMQERTTASSFEWTAKPSWNATQRWACTRWPGPWSSRRERIGWKSSTGKTAAGGA